MTIRDVGSLVYVPADNAYAYVVEVSPARPNLGHTRTYAIRQSEAQKKSSRVSFLAWLEEDDLVDVVRY